MHYINSLSGGLASAATALIAHEKGLKVTNVFADTTIEDPDLYRFLDDIEAIVGPIVRLKDGRDPWDVFVDKRFIGNSRTAHCSIVLKTDQVKAWMGANASGATLVLGMYRDEEDRLERAQKNWVPIPVTSLLIDNKVTPGAANELVKSHGLRRPNLYDRGFPHNNCGGFCVRAGQGQFATLLTQLPERYAHHEARQEYAHAAIGPTARGFIQVERKGVRYYLTMREFREEVEAGTLTPKMYEMGGCGCFVDDEKE